MAIEYTQEQKKVIFLRNRNLLVSAAAGSGKTAVLVERIIARLTKDENPINVDEMLIVTFTKAAAAEMKERIHTAIEKALQTDPTNAHLQRQATLIHQAQINTIDKFCLNVIRDYFYLIDLDPGYRVIEPGEAKLLKKDVVKEVLEHAFANATEPFVDFVESFAIGKDDQTLEELILKLAENADQYPEPVEWLDACVEKYDTEKYDYYQIVFLKAREVLFEVAREVQKVMELCMCEDGPSGYRPMIESDCAMLERMLSCDSFEQLQREMSVKDWMKLKSNPAKTAKEKALTAKETRKHYKALVDELQEMYFFETRTGMEDGMTRAKEHVKAIVDLVKDYMSAYAGEKKRRNLIDFGDMEHFALRILTRKEGDTIVPSEVAEAYQKKFAEVMVDEYQDSNYVQEAILSSVSGVSKGIYNRFMVGDVKQSIYRFRLSKPELFMEKHETYSLTDGLEQRIDLHKNFRSRKEVLDSCNLVFEQIMTRGFGGIEYDENAALYVGADYTEQKGNETELLLLEVDKVRTDNNLEMEVEMIAARIEELMAHHLIRDKNRKTYRKMCYKDIAILSRGLKKYIPVIKRVFENREIPIFLGPQKGYFETPEIALILDYLKALDNPLQDIPFAAVLTSFEHVTSNELAQIRAMGKKATIYENVQAYLECGENEVLKGRMREFWEQFHQLRERVSYMAIHEFLWILLHETGYLDEQSVMPGGVQRKANLEMLVEKAIAYESTSYKGLFNFVRYIEQLQVYNEETGEAVVLDESLDAVNVMTVHGSKGLEFPVVFLAGVSANFNTKEASASVVNHATWGIGISSIDSVMRVKKTTLLKNVIRMEIMRENVAEEIRLLYVAMTRAKEKLIMTATATRKSLEEREAFLDILSEHEDKALPCIVISSANKYLDWILAAVHRTRADMSIRVERKTVGDMVLTEAERMHYRHIKKMILENWDVNKVYSEETKERLEKQFSFIYPYQEIDRIKQKLSVSELKKKQYGEESQEMFKEEEVVPLLPKFLQHNETLTGASKGTAYHKLMELLDVSLDYDEECLRKVIEEKMHMGYLDEQMVTCIDVADILRFLQSPAGKRMQAAGRREMCFSEQPFVIGLEAAEVYPDVDTDEVVLVQGIIDVYFEENGELVVLDYKTDKVSCMSELKERYREQLKYYAQALEKLTGKKVKEKIIYSFYLHEEILV